MRQISQKVLRGLTAAEGYLELGMPTQALRELEGVADAGPLSAAVDLLTGQALVELARHEDALAPLERAARALPAPQDQVAWDALNACLKLCGEELAGIAAEVFAGESGIPEGWDDGWPADWEGVTPEETITGFAYAEDVERQGESPLLPVPR